MDQQLRLWLAGRLKTDPKNPMFDKLWGMLESEQHVAYVTAMDATGDEDEEEKAKENLLRAARLLRPYAAQVEKPSRRAKGGGTQTSQGTLRLDGYERERAEALGEYLVLRSTLHPLVRRFRGEVFGGEMLTPDQAYALIDSDAAKRFPVGRFEQEGIPVVGHTAWFHEHGAVFKEGDLDRFIEFEYIFVDPPGKLFRAHLPVSVAYDDLEYLRFPSRNRRGVRNGGYSSVPRDAVYTHTPVYPGSVLDDLRRLSQRLVESWRCWDEAQAAWFILTGEAVAPKALTATYNHHGSEHLTYGTITLTVEPWVPAETVVKFYQDLQIGMLGQKPRAPSRRNLAVFRFVTKHLKETFLREDSQGEASEQPPWHELMEGWNQENPDCEYTKESRFIRDFHRGGRAVASPYNVADMDIPMRLSIP